MKKNAAKPKQRAPSQGQSFTVLSLFSIVELVSLLILPVLICLYWLWEVLV